MGIIFEVVTDAGYCMFGSPISTTVSNKSDGTEKEKRQNSHGTVAGSGSRHRGMGPCEGRQS